MSDRYPDLDDTPTKIFKIEIQRLVRRAQRLYAEYRHLEVYHSHLPLTNRRFLLEVPSSTPLRVRQITKANFLLAAVLQWSPTTYGFDVSRFEADGGGSSGVAQSRGTVGDDDEGWYDLCPVWKDFFDDLVEVDRAISAWKSDSNSLVELNLLNKRMASAEQKYIWTEKVLNLVARSPGWKSSSEEFMLEQSMVYTDWNRFCMRLASGLDLETALDKRRFPLTIAGVEYTLIVGSSGKRQFFSFDLGSSFDSWT